MDIEFKNIHKSFGQKKVLADINMVIPQGQAFFIMGESGSGKTTLANILAGILKPDTGEITGMDGVKISMVFQDERLLPWLSAAENVRFSAGSAKKDLKFKDKTEHLFNALNLSGDMNKNINELSGGMQRRLSIIRALAVDFDLLILDEAFKGLDELSKYKAMDTIISAALGKTIVLVTHDNGDADYFGKAVNVNKYMI